MECRGSAVIIAPWFFRHHFSCSLPSVKKGGASFKLLFFSFRSSVSFPMTSALSGHLLWWFSSKVTSMTHKHTTPPPVLGRCTAIIPEDGQAVIMNVALCYVSREWTVEYLATLVSSSLIEKRVRGLVQEARLSPEVHLFIPRRHNRVMVPPQGYCSTYKRQFRAGLLFDR